MLLTLGNGPWPPEKELLASFEPNELTMAAYGPLLRPFFAVFTLLHFTFYYYYTELSPQSWRWFFGAFIRLTVKMSEKRREYVFELFTDCKKNHFARWYFYIHSIFHSQSQLFLGCSSLHTEEQEDFHRWIRDEMCAWVEVIVNEIAVEYNWWRLLWSSRKKKVNEI